MSTAQQPKQQQQTTTSSLNSSSNVAAASATTRNATQFIPTTTTYKPQPVQPEPIQSTLSRKTKNENSILVSERQRGNPILQYIRAIPYEYINNILPDYILGETCCALYISMKYHMSHPKYLQNRLDTISKSYFTTRILLVQVDIDIVYQCLQELTLIAIKNNYIMICCYSLQETARYIETFKVYENKSSNALHSKIDDTDNYAIINDLLTNIKSVNKTDVITLTNTYHTFSNICNASIEELAILPGFGEKKVKRLYNTLHGSFHDSNNKSTLLSNRTNSGSIIKPNISPQQSPTLQPTKVLSTPSTTTPTSTNANITTNTINKRPIKPPIHIPTIAETNSVNINNDNSQQLQPAYNAADDALNTVLAATTTNNDTTDTATASQTTKTKPKRALSAKTSTSSGKPKRSVKSKQTTIQDTTDITKSSKPSKPPFPPQPTEIISID